MLTDTSRISQQNSRGMHEYELGIRQSFEGIRIGNQSDDTTILSHSPHFKIKRYAANNLKCLLQSGLCEEINLLEVIPAAAVASMLVDVVCCTEKIAESIYELASLAQFICVEPMVEAEKPKLLHQETVPPCCSINEPHHVITIDQPSPKLQ